MGLFSRKPKYAGEQLARAKQVVGSNEFLISQVNDLRDRLQALERYLEIYAMRQPSKYVYQKGGPAGLVGSALQGLAPRD